ncbi:hypothetical protein AVEN_229702-1 [Araneus ventricosus]|uniref:Uncharacterized protein n=1 Tax=Araneus ventricosus TaxID=182803 RepID=A0A4Y2R6D3_ARAVE|nr:hypothetical protein AVEN_229702-1 [Araneus ventricosus]
MVLIPEDWSEIVDHLSDLGAKMNTFFKEKMCWKRKTETTEVQETSISENQEPETVPEEDVITTKILKSGPVGYLNTVKNILDFLKDNHSILSWTPEGEIVYKGQRIPRTNVVNLVADLLRNRKKSPSRFKEFRAALKEMRIPATYL